MLTAIPGRGRITRVTIADTPDDDNLAARLVPHLHPGADADATEAIVDGDGLVDIVSHVDLVLPHAGGAIGATGLVVTFLDSDAARAFGRACYRAAVLLGQQVPASALDSVDDSGSAIPVEDLPDVAYAGPSA